MLEVRPHTIVGFPVGLDTAMALAAAHQVFRSDGQRFRDVDFLPSVAAPNLACRRLDHFCPSIIPLPVWPVGLPC